MPSLAFLLAPWLRARWLHADVPDSQIGPEPVRAAMHALVADLAGARAERLARAIRVAPDVRALWLLRSGLMDALAARHGELQARQALLALDPLFREGWPQAPISRPAALV
jgi:hypothetical protein